MFSLKVVQPPHFSYSQDILDGISENISKNIPTHQIWTLNIVFLDAVGIQNLNKKYRNIDAPTDVLSFHYVEDFSVLTDDDVAGELVFCEEKIISQAQQFGLGVQKEFYKLLIHSLLHILGFDHETDEEYEEMRTWEQDIWKDMFAT